MSLPTKTTRRPVEPRELAPGGADVAGERGALRRRLGLGFLQRGGRARAASPPPRPAARARTPRRRRRAGPAASARRPTGRPAPPTATRRCGASPTSTPRAGPSPSRAHGRKRAGSRLTTYSRALPWIFTAYGTPSSARARIAGPHHGVVGQRDVGPDALGDLPHGGHVAGHVVLDLLVGALEERPGLDPVVAVGDVDRQQAAEVRAVGGAAHGIAQPPQLQALAAVPIAVRVDEGQPLGRPFLAEEMDLVAGPYQRPRELGVVDVRTRPAQQVAVEDKDFHERQRIEEVWEAAIYDGTSKVQRLCL